MKVTKADGSKEEFDEAKIAKTCVRAGTSRRVGREIASSIREKVSEGTTTHDIYRMILEELGKREDKSSLLFRLREAVAMLGGESFELYVKAVLEADDYSCSWNKKIKGLLVEHQVDIVAVKENQTFLVECKRHVNPHRYTGLNICLQVQARIEDVNDGGRKQKNRYGLTVPWIVTNSKFSEHAKKYARGKKMRLSGWRYEPGLSLERLIHRKSMFPITILKGYDKFLLEKGIITVHDFLNSRISKNAEYTGLKEQALLLLK